MRRFGVLCALLLVCLTGGPARAVQPWVVTGTITFPSLTPTVERMVWDANGSSSNGRVGYVFTLPTWSDGEAYELRKTSGVGNPDVYFYADDDGELGGFCAPVVDQDGTLINSQKETGVVCRPSDGVARYAMVILFSGIDVGFRLTVFP